MITVKFFLEGSEPFVAPMPELPRMGEYISVGGITYVVKTTHWNIAGGEFDQVCVFGDYSVFALQEIPYPVYLTSRHWKKKREDALAKADHACQLCNTQQATLDVHHRTYDRRGWERPEDLIVLCRACHSKFHAGDPAGHHTIEDALRMYGEKIGRPTPIIARMIEEAAPVYGIETIIRAIGVADGADVRKWTYVEGVLRNWKEQQAQL